MLSCLLVLAAVVWAYWPALWGTPLWDDDRHLTAPGLRGWEGLRRIWCEPGATQQYYPLLHSAFWLEQHLWGDAYLGYHLFNLGQHLCSAVLLVLILRRLAVPGALLTGAVFALHPVHVESVAWMTEQKNTLSLLFMLGAALVYLRFADSRHRGSYLVASGLFVLGLLTKTVTATLPAALLVLAWWHRGHIEWRRDGRPLLPWFVLGAAAGLGTAWIEHQVIGAHGPEYALSALQRVLLAGRIVWFYAGHLFWPDNLTFIYPRWSIDPGVFWQWLPAVGVLLVTALFWRFRKRSRAPLAAWLLFLGMLFPVAGFFNIYPFRYSYVADHFQYFANPAIMALVCAALSMLSDRLHLSLRVLPACGLLAVLALATRAQTPMYQDVDTLWHTTLKKNPACWMAHNNLGYSELLRGDRSAAEQHFRAALELNPEFFDARNNLGLTLSQQGRSQEALPHLKKAVVLDPDSAQAYNNLGIALIACGDIAAALQAFERASELMPEAENIRKNLAKARRLLPSGGAPRP